MTSLKMKWSPRGLFFITVICLIKAQGAIARSNMISLSKSWGSGLSNGGFGLKIGQLLRKLRQFWSLWPVLGPPNHRGASLFGACLY